MSYPTDRDFEDARRRREPPSIRRDIDTDEIRHALRDAEEELRRAVGLHAPFNSAHEGYAVILEELDELWEEVRKRHKDDAAMRKEAMQVAAMALRFMVNVCPGRFRG